MSEIADAMVSRRSERQDQVRVWDPFVRVFHWSLVSLFLFAYFSAEDWNRGHRLAGYTIAGLVALRIVWGFVGSHHARFSSFLFHPTTVVRFLGDSVKMKAPRHLGHNPAGGAMVVVLLIMIGVIAGTGYMMTTDAYWGVEWVQDLHEAVANLTMGLVALHVAGVVLASFEHKENLVRAMVTGFKRRD